MREIEYEVEGWVSYFMHHYPTMTEYDILAKDWDWVDFHHKAIEDRRNEERRFQMVATMTSCAAGFNGGEAMDEWNRIYESLLNPTELKAVREEEERRLREAEEAAREEKISEWLARKEAETQAEQTEQEVTRPTQAQPGQRGLLLSSG